jgi:hypothetical protein
MGRSRTSIAGLMLFTALFALHCLVARAAWGGEHDSLYVAVGLLMADVLTAGLVSLRRRKRAGRSGRFLAGFEAGGWSALLLYAACCVLARGPMQVYGNSMFSFVSAVTGLERLGGIPSTVGAYVNLAALILAHTAILLVPQLVLALVVGLLTRRFGPGGSIGEPDSGRPPLPQTDGDSG